MHGAGPGAGGRGTPAGPCSARRRWTSWTRRRCRPRCRRRRRAVAARPGRRVTDLLVATGLVGHRSAARRAVEEGGAYVNNVRVARPGRCRRRDGLPARPLAGAAPREALRGRRRAVRRAGRTDSDGDLTARRRRSVVFAPLLRREERTPLGGRSRGRLPCGFPHDRIAPDGGAVVGRRSDADRVGFDPAGPTAKLGGLPRRSAGRPASVRVRSLRTQQRAKSQCQTTPSLGSAADLRSVRAAGRIPLVKTDDSNVCIFARSDGHRLIPIRWPLSVVGDRALGRDTKQTSTESLILAQDERWRRA